MKKVILSVCFLIACAFGVKAQNMVNDHDATLKAHTCTAACKPGAHVYAHGEEGHVCTAACAAMQDEHGHELKDHVCTSACTADAHVYAHGEKGHVCTAACKE